MDDEAAPDGPRLDESQVEFRARRTHERLDAANARRKELQTMRRAIKLGLLNGQELLRGRHPEYEGVIADWQIGKLLKAIPRLGETRVFDVLSTAQIAPGTRIRALTWAKREELARMVERILPDLVMYEVWADALRFAWVLAKSARASELRGDRRNKAFDPRGLHLYSVEWGRVWACEECWPALAELRASGDYLLDPITMRAQAAREAEREFEDDARAGRIEWAH